MAQSKATGAADFQAEINEPRCLHHRDPSGALEFCFEQCSGGPVPGGAVDYHFDPGYPGRPIMNATFASEQHIMTRKSKESVDRKRAWMAARFVFAREETFEDEATVLMNNHEIYDLRKWRRIDGGVPEIVLGPNSLDKSKRAATGEERRQQGRRISDLRGYILSATGKITPVQVVSAGSDSEIGPSEKELERAVADFNSQLRLKEIVESVEESNRRMLVNFSDVSDDSVELMKAALRKKEGPEKLEGKEVTIGTNKSEK